MFLIGRGRDPEGVRASHQPFPDARGEVGSDDGLGLRGWGSAYRGGLGTLDVLARS